MSWQTFAICIYGALQNVGQTGAFDQGAFLYIYIYNYLLLVGPGASPGQGARAASIGNFWAKAFNYIYRDIYILYIYLPHLGTVDGIYI